MMADIIPFSESPPEPEGSVTNMLLELFLNHKFWVDHNHMVNQKYFEKESKKIYDVLTDAHEKYEGDLSVTELEALLWAKNPMLTGAQRGAILDITKRMRGEIRPEVGSDILLSAFREHLGKTIAELGLQLMDGTIKDLSLIQELLEKYENGLEIGDDLGFVSNEWDDMFKANKVNYPWTWNLTQLHMICPGIGPGTLTTVFALVETGKSAFAISTAFSPRGFADQGARVLMICNEEVAERTMDRAGSAYSALETDQVIDDRLKGRTTWDGIKDNIQMVDGENCQTMERLNFIISKGGPFDIVIIDQLDKMQVAGIFTRDDLRLSQVYIKARTIAKKHDLAMIAVSQADATADGRTSLRFTQMANSKIGKAAEADVIIGIGKEATDSTDDNFLRYLHVSKNKLGGIHGRATVQIEPKISRYID
jgi:hypothetical protein